MITDGWTEKEPKMQLKTKTIATLKTFELQILNDKNLFKIFQGFTH